MSGDKLYRQTGTAEPLVLLPGKAGHELLTGARSNEVKMSHLAPCSSVQTTMLVWTTVLRPHSRLQCQQVTCLLYPCHDHISDYLRLLYWALCRLFDSLHTCLHSVNTMLNSNVSHAFRGLQCSADHVKKNYKKRGKKCAASIFSQLVSTH